MERYLASFQETSKQISRIFGWKLLNCSDSVIGGAEYLKVVKSIEIITRGDAATARFHAEARGFMAFPQSIDSAAVL
jgi:hypothetical protein